MKLMKNVDSYIKSAPKEIQSKLKQLRAAIKTNAPKSQEKISYGMPYYGYKGRLAYFAFSKKHIGFYVMPKTMKEHEKEVSKYRSGKATLQFPFDKKIPIALVKKLIKTGVKINSEKKK